MTQSARARSPTWCSRRRVWRRRTSFSRRRRFVVSRCGRSASGSAPACRRSCSKRRGEPGWSRGVQRLTIMATRERALARSGAKARDIARLTGHSLWRGFLGFYNSDNLTYAASIALLRAAVAVSVFHARASRFSAASRPIEHDRADGPRASSSATFPPSSTSSPGSSTRSAPTRATFGVAGTIALVWGALGFFGAISTAVNYAWGVEKTAQLLEAQAVLVPDAARRRR